MNSITIVFTLVLLGLSVLCFFLPYKYGHKTTGLTVSLILVSITTLTLVLSLDFLAAIIWLVILAFQVVFISYWAFRRSGKIRAANFSALIFTGTFLFIAAQPWLSDWTYSKNDARQLIQSHGFDLKDDFEILENESGGIRDYYHILNLKLTEADYDRITKQIKSSKNYAGLFTDLTQTPTADYKTYDTVNFETNHHFEREYFSIQKRDDGTYHFRFQLSKTDKGLSYIASDE